MDAVQGLRRIVGHAGLAEKYFHFLEKYFAFYLHSILKPLTFVRSKQRSDDSFLSLSKICNYELR
jgi:hypothetical protein